VAETARALGEARAALAASLSLQEGPARPPPSYPGGLSMLPIEAPADDVMPWLLRRLQVLAHDAQCVQAAANEAIAKARRR